VPLHELPSCVFTQLGQSHFCVAVVVLEHHVVALGDNALVVIVAYASAHCVVIHVRLVLGLPPEMSHIFVVQDGEFGNITVDPSYLVVVVLLGEKFQEETPQLWVDCKWIKEREVQDGSGTTRIYTQKGNFAQSVPIWLIVGHLLNLVENACLFGGKTSLCGMHLYNYIIIMACIHTHTHV